jgi:PhnB protein
VAVKPVPDGFHTLTPHITVKGASKAIDFYKKAFGAELLNVHKMEGGDQVMHALMRIGDSMLMLNDEWPDQGALGPDPSRRSAVALSLYVDNADRWFERATKAGAKAMMPPADMFWGDRYSMVTDPFGHLWAIATHKEDVSPAQMTERAKQAFSKGCSEEHA